MEKILPKKLIDISYWSTGFNPKKPSEEDMIDFNRKQFILMLLIWCILPPILFLNYNPL